MIEVVLVSIGQVVVERAMGVWVRQLGSGISRRIWRIGRVAETSWRVGVEGVLIIWRGLLGLGL